MADDTINGLSLQSQTSASLRNTESSKFQKRSLDDSQTIEDKKVAQFKTDALKSNISSGSDSLNKEGLARAQKYLEINTAVNTNEVASPKKREEVSTKLKNISSDNKNALTDVDEAESLASFLSTSITKKPELAMGAFQLNEDVSTRLLES
jgi:uncharacterized membrane-anchored protein